MDLRVTITDENQEVLQDVTIYQEGSDSEGAAEIIRLISSAFTIEDNDDDA